MRHTKGPWTLDLRQDRARTVIGARHQIVVEENRKLILVASVPARRPVGPLCLEECSANAQLMSAAPELLTALKWAESLIAHNVKETDESVQVLAMILEVIAKAEGKS